MKSNVYRHQISCLCALVFLFGCATEPTRLTPSLHPQKLAEMDAAISSAISSNKLPGGVLWVEHEGAVYHRAYGNRCVDPVEPMTEDTIFDAASLTKVIATTSA